MSLRRNITDQQKVKAIEKSLMHKYPALKDYYKKIAEIKICNRFIKWLVENYELQIINEDDTDDKPTDGIDLLYEYMDIDIKLVRMQRDRLDAALAEIRFEKNLEEETSDGDDVEIDTL